MSLESQQSRIVVIRGRGRRTVETLTGERDLVMVKQLNDDQFLPLHPTVSMELLTRLAEGKGVVLGIRDENGAVIAAAQSAYPSTRASDDGLPIDLPMDCAYLEGAVVHPAYRGQGLHRFLVEARLSHARENGFLEVVASTGRQNIASQSSLFGCGLEIRGWIDNYFLEDRKETGRMVWHKSLDQWREWNVSRPVDVTGAADLQAAMEAHLAVTVKTVAKAIDLESTYNMLCILGQQGWRGIRHNFGNGSASGTVSIVFAPEIRDFLTVHRILDVRHTE